MYNSTVVIFCPRRACVWERLRFNSILSFFLFILTMWGCTMCEGLVRQTGLNMHTPGKLSLSYPHTPFRWTWREEKWEESHSLSPALKTRLWAPDVETQKSHIKRQCIRLCTEPASQDCQDLMMIDCCLCMLMLKVFLSLHNCTRACTYPQGLDILFVSSFIFSITLFI